MRITHIAGTFLIDAAGAFLNGQGLATQEDKNFMKIKTFQDGQLESGRYYEVPYVSSQAWRRWLRNTLIEENPNWEPSRMRALHYNKQGNTDKVGGEFNPVEFPEDDIFGYMRTAKKVTVKKAGEKVEVVVVAEEDKEEEEEDEKESIKTNQQQQQQQGRPVKTVSRTSPFSSSILMSLQKIGWRGEDQAYVHLVKGTPVPYKIQFYNTSLQGIFCLNCKRLGVFTNIGDRMELDEDIADEFKENKKITLLEDQSKHAIYYSLENNDTNGAKKTKQEFKQVKETGKVYELTNAEEARNERYIF